MRLGIGSWRAMMCLRGGQQLQEIPYAWLDCSRVLDDMSSASCMVGLSDPRAGVDALAFRQAAAELDAWEHELALYRDDSLAWVGPVIEPEFSTSTVTFKARDLFQWFERRLIEANLSFINQDLADIFSAFATQALTRDATPNISFDVGASGVLGTRSTQAAIPRRAADELRELSRSGVDFTMIGRTLKVGGQEIPTEELPLLTNVYFTPDPMPVRGLEQGSEWVVIGGNVSGTSPTGRAGGVDEVTGLVQQTANESLILDEDSCTAAAESRYAAFRLPPPYLTGTLLPDAPMSFDQLVPGARWPVRVEVGVKRLQDTMRLLSVNVTQNKAQGERIKVSLGPLGTTDG